MRRLGVKLGGGARLKTPIQNAHVPKSRVSELGGVKALRHSPHLPYPLLTCPPISQDLALRLGEWSEWSEWSEWGEWGASGKCDRRLFPPCSRNAENSACEVPRC